MVRAFGSQTPLRQSVLAKNSDKTLRPDAVSREPQVVCDGGLCNLVNSSVVSSTMTAVPSSVRFSSYNSVNVPCRRSNNNDNNCHRDTRRWVCGGEKRETKLRDTRIPFPRIVRATCVRQFFVVAQRNVRYNIDFLLGR